MDTENKLIFMYPISVPVGLAFGMRVGDDAFVQADFTYSGNSTVFTQSQGQSLSALEQRKLIWYILSKTQGAALKLVMIDLYMHSTDKAATRYCTRGGTLKVSFHNFREIPGAYEMELDSKDVPFEDVDTLKPITEEQLLGIDFKIRARFNCMKENPLDYDINARLKHALQIVIQGKNAPLELSETVMEVRKLTFRLDIPKSVFIHDDVKRLYNC